MKRFLIFVGGMAVGAYIAYNKQYKDAAKATIEAYEKKEETEDETED